MIDQYVEHVTRKMIIRDQLRDHTHVHVVIRTKEHKLNRLLRIAEQFRQCMRFH